LPRPGNRVAGQALQPGGELIEWGLYNGLRKKENFLIKHLPDRPARVIELAARPTSNQEIVRGLARGDSAAAEALYERFGEMVNNLVRIKDTIFSFIRKVSFSKTPHLKPEGAEIEKTVVWFVLSSLHECCIDRRCFLILL
jgi:hypothetical protein